MRHRHAALIGSAVITAMMLPGLATARAGTVPISSFSAPGFGTVLANSAGKALYYWNKETARRIRCTGSCAQVWPVIYVPKGARVPRRIRGYAGVFGTVKRPGSNRRQLTWNNRPVYSYLNEGRHVVTCDNVDKWFVVRLRPG